MVSQSGITIARYEMARNRLVELVNVGLVTDRFIMLERKLRTRASYFVTRVELIGLSLYIERFRDGGIKRKAIRISERGVLLLFLCLREINVALYCHALGRYP